MTELDIFNVVLQTVIAVSASAAAVITYGKLKLHQLRLLFDSVDDAATDNKVTEAEFQDVLSKARDIRNK